MNLPAIVYAAARRLTDHGLRDRVHADETRREMDAAREWLEGAYKFCRCGELIGDASGLQGHMCSRRWVS